ncbi:hypothetical protein ACLB2K_049684 [Fragaria x ananassa]
MLMNLGLPHQGGVPLKKDSVYSGLLPQGHVMSAPENAHQMLIHPQNLILQATTLFLVTRPRLSYTEKNTRHNIGAVLVAPYLVPYSDSPEDIAATEKSYDFNLGWFLEPFVYGEYPKSMKEVVKERLPSFSAEEKSLIKGSLDFVGMSYYKSFYVKNKQPSPT